MWRHDGLSWAPALAMTLGVLTFLALLVWVIVAGLERGDPGGPSVAPNCAITSSGAACSALVSPRPTMCVPTEGPAQLSPARGSWHNNPPIGGERSAELLHFVGVTHAPSLGDQPRARFLSHR